MVNISKITKSPRILKLRRWITLRLVALAAKTHSGLFVHLCEAVVLAKHREALELAIETSLDIKRLEQEHEYDRSYEYEVQDDWDEWDADTDASKSAGEKSTTVH